jgi:hypothetical protein
MIRRLCKEPKLPDCLLSFSFTSFWKRDAGYTDALQANNPADFFCVRGKILRKNEGQSVLLLTPNSFPNAGILPLWIRDLPTALLSPDTPHSPC